MKNKFRRNSLTTFLKSNQVEELGNSTKFYIRCESFNNGLHHISLIAENQHQLRLTFEKINSSVFYQILGDMMEFIKREKLPLFEHWLQMEYYEPNEFGKFRKIESSHDNYHVWNSSPYMTEEQKKNFQLI